MSEIVGVGIDTIELDRMRAVLERTPGLQTRAFTAGERAYCLAKRDPTERFAARFAAKEAVLKVLGAGILQVPLRDIEVERAPSGKPSICLHDRAAARAAAAGITAWQLSLTHTERAASAVAVGVAGAGGDADPDAAFYRSLDRKRNAAAALLFDGEGRLLVVEPTYERGWTLPGGAVDAGESPRQGCEREILEEIGLRRRVGRLVAVEWRPHPRKGEGMLYLFDGGTLSAGEIDSIVLPPDELSAWALLAPAEAVARIGSDAKARRIEAALAARESGEVAWLDDGAVAGSEPGPA